MLFELVFYGEGGHLLQYTSILGLCRCMFFERYIDIAVSGVVRNVIFQT